MANLNADEVDLVIPSSPKRSEDDEATRRYIAERKQTLNTTATAQRIRKIVEARSQQMSRADQTP